MAEIKEPEPKKRIGIVGAGVSGLIAIKTCLEYGLEPVCFEKSFDIGGTWRFKPEPVEGESSVMKSTIINTSKEMMAFSDFPPPDHFPTFMHNTKVLEYFRLYAENFGLEKYITYHAKVTRVERHSSHRKTGAWSLTWEKDGVSKTEKFDAVLLGSGHHVDPYTPRFPGLDSFQGRVLHSHSYKDARPFFDEDVLVVGIGNSGGDATTEISRMAKQVYLSTRSSTWCAFRIGYFGIPLDYMLNSRLFNWFVINWITLSNEVVSKCLMAFFNHDRYGLYPRHDPFSQHVMLNDDLPNRIASGTVRIKPDVQNFQKDGVTFVDGTSVKLDSVLLCTGYTFGFPFLEDGVIPVDANRVSLFKYMYQPDIDHPESLAILGLIQPLGAINAIVELQCRLFCQVLKGERSLPKLDDMRSDIVKKREAMAKRYMKSQRHTIQVDYVPFMDELAELAGVKPSIVSTFFKDPKLGLHLLAGPTTPYHFRLEGSHSDPKASRSRVFSAGRRTCMGLSGKTQELHVKSLAETIPRKQKAWYLKFLCYSIIAFFCGWSILTAFLLHAYFW